MNIAILLAFTGVVCGRVLAAQPVPTPPKISSERSEPKHLTLEQSLTQPIVLPAEAEQNFVRAVEAAAKAAHRTIEKDEAALIAWRCVAGEGVPIPEWTAELLEPENWGPEKDETPYIGAVLEKSGAWRVCFKDVAIPCSAEGGPANVAKRDVVVLLHAGTGRLLKISLRRDGAPDSFQARPRLDAVELISHSGGETWLDLPEKVTLDFLSAAKLVRPFGAGVCGADRVEAVLVTRRAFPAEVQTVWSIELIGIPPHGIGHGPREARTYLRHIIDAENRK